MQARNEFKTVLLKQHRLYPKIQPQDIIKLIYQNEFAGRNIIASKKESLRQIEAEYQALSFGCLSRGSFHSTSYHYIGNGLCRLNLAAAKQDYQIEPSTVNEFFLQTAYCTAGSIEGFEAKLGLFKQYCQEGLLPYSVEELDQYLRKYKAQVYPPVGHSKTFNDAYSPAYRVVKVEYGYYLKIFSLIDALIRTKDNIKLAIDGNAAAGKTTLAALIAAIYDCNVFKMDHFFLRPKDKTEERLKEIGGNVDYIRFKRQVIEKLDSGGVFGYRVYNCKKNAWGRYINVTPKPISIIEGVYSMHPSLVGSYDLKIFLSINAAEQEKRILNRNGPVMQKQFLQQWIPLENKYFNALKIKDQSDLVLKGFVP
ncbi:MAG TPA: hypothetical protein VJ036_06135 [bacterium]|nr:hypothetical protein [bacterium]